MHTTSSSDWLTELQRSEREMRCKTTSTSIFIIWLSHKKRQIHKNLQDPQKPVRLCSFSCCSAPRRLAHELWDRKLIKKIKLNNVKTNQIWGCVIVGYDMLHLIHRLNQISQGPLIRSIIELIINMICITAIVALWTVASVFHVNSNSSLFWGQHPSAQSQ